MKYEIIDQLAFKFSRWYNTAVLGIALFLIKNVWDQTKRNKDLIQEAKQKTKFLKDIIGN